MNDKFEEVLDPDIFKDCKGDLKKTLMSVKINLKSFTKKTWLF